MLYDTVQAPAREYLAHPLMKILERGPVRGAIEITRKAAGSTFVQRVRLAAGGDRVEVENLVDWRSPDTLLKASFTLAAANSKATYDLGVGTIDRTNNEPDKYEVPAQKWADITDASRSFGVGILNDSKYGWDKPTDDTLRLTLIHTPRPRGGYTYQSSNDLGHHRFVYAIAGHAGDWRQGRLPLRAAELNQPLIAFSTTAHDGPLGASFSMLTLDDTSGQVAAVALKKAEDSDEIIVRLQERYGQPARPTLRFAGNLVAAREVTATEEPLAPIDLAAGRPSNGRGQPPPTSFPTVTLDLKPYQPRAIAVKLQPAAVHASADFVGGGRGAGRGGGNGAPAPELLKAPAVIETPIDLPFNLDGASTDADRGDGDFDGAGHALAGEQLPRQLLIDGVTFQFGPTTTGAKNVLVPKGERLALPDGSFTRLYLIAASVGGDVPMTIGTGATPTTVTVREWQGPIGQWWSRLKAPSALREPFVPASAANAPQGRGGNPSQAEIQSGLVVEWNPTTGVVTGLDQIRPAFVKRDEIAWVGTHRHTRDGKSDLRAELSVSLRDRSAGGHQGDHLAEQRPAAHPGGNRGEKRASGQTGRGALRPRFQIVVRVSGLAGRHPCPFTVGGRSRGSRMSSDGPLRRLCYWTALQWRRRVVGMKKVCPGRGACRSAWVRRPFPQTRLCSPEDGCGSGQG